jgi:hypothetical protein
MAYAPADELARILTLTAPTAAQETALQRCLDSAAEEIDIYLGPDVVGAFADKPPALVVEVNLARAVEHWKQEQSPFGIVALGGDSPPSYAARNTWRRHAQTLLPLKASYGIA